MRFCTMASETNTGSLLWGSPKCLREKYNDVLSSQRNNLLACLLQLCWLRFYLTNFGFSICLHLNRTMTPFQKLFYFRKSQAVYSQSSQKYANKTQTWVFNLSSSYFNCGCGTVWCWVQLSHCIIVCASMCLPVQWAWDENAVKD